MNPLLYFAFFALYGVGMTGFGSVYNRPWPFYMGIIVAILNALQFSYWLLQ